MELIVDGFLFRRPGLFGIKRVLTETLSRLGNLEPQLRITLLIESGTPLHALPRGERMRYLAVPDLSILGRLNRPLQLLIARALTGRGATKVWLPSTYRVAPLWSGAQVMFMYDLIYETHGERHKQPGHIRKQIGSRERAIARADRILCISDATRSDLVSFYPEAAGKAVVVHLAHSPVFRLLRERELQVSENFILYVGNRGWHKGFDTLVQAYSRWSRRGDFRLVCVGRNWRDVEREQFLKLGLAELVDVYTGADDETLAGLYNQAAAFVYPSLAEGFGIPLLEAMACGCPLVASRIPSTLEVAQDVPYLFTPGDPESLLAALDEAVRSGRSAPKVQTGLDLVRSFSWDATTHRLLDILRPLFAQTA